MKLTPFLERMSLQIRGYLDRHLGELRTELRALEVQFKSMPAPRDGVDGINGHTPTVDELKAIIVPLIPEPIPGAKGDPGIDGKSVTIDEVRALIPAPIKGDKGDPGIDGKSITVEDCRELVLKVVTEKQAEWALDFERRAQGTLQRAIENIPKPKDGTNGRDAFELQDIDLTIEDDRTLKFAFVRGTERIEKAVVLPFPVYQGVWTAKAYRRGDSVSHGGSQFIAVRDTDSRPETDDSWRLAVKRGRDGKDFVRTARDPNQPVKL